MDEFFRFIQKSERERIRLILEAAPYATASSRRQRPSSSKAKERQLVMGSTL